jgi:GntR family histidine utilization transcriptional repressor
MTVTTHQGIREAIRARIVAGEWSLGDLMPGEVEFALEYGCARTTVNRALRALADDGMIERKRKGGTRVRPLPLPPAQLRIPVLREQVENTNRTYSHRVTHKAAKRTPAAIRERLQIAETVPTIYLETLHLADDRPFAFERRWINLAAVPQAEHADLTELSANEWLVRTVPFSRGEVSLSATRADADLASALSAKEGAAIFTLDRTTWLDGQAVTAVTFYYAEGYRLNFSI